MPWTRNVRTRIPKRNLLPSLKRIEKALRSAIQMMVQVTPTISRISKGQRKSVTAARIMEGDTTPTIQVTVNVTMPMELQMKSFSPTFPKSDDSKGGKDKPYKEWRDDYQQLAL